MSASPLIPPVEATASSSTGTVPASAAHMIHTLPVNSVSFIPPTFGASTPHQNYTPPPLPVPPQTNGTTQTHAYVRASIAFQEAKAEFDTRRAALAAEVNPTPQQVRAYDAELKKHATAMLAANDAMTLIVRFAVGKVERRDPPRPDPVIHKIYDAHLLTQARLQSRLQTRKWNP